jgi:DNA-binding XRE family transcriptional regulator
MISASQIKAARAMLDWSQDDLARESGLSTPTIYNLEKGHISSRSAKEVRRIFEDNGFEFYENNGLARCPQNVKVYRGEKGGVSLFEDMISTLKSKSSDVIAIFRNQNSFAQALGISDISCAGHFDLLGKNSRIRCLVSDGGSFLQIPSVEFRLLPKEYNIRSAYFLIYGNKYAIVTDERNNEVFHIVISSASQAQIGLHEFLPLWEKAAPIL